MSLSLSEYLFLFFTISILGFRRLPIPRRLLLPGAQQAHPEDSRPLRKGRLAYDVLTRWAYHHKHRAKIQF